MRLLLALSGVALALGAAGQESVPAELLPLVPAGTKYLAHASADLNGDGRRDYVLVVERDSPGKSSDGTGERRRPLLVVVRQPNGSLATKRIGERAVLCEDCGGAFGDPFQSVVARKNAFSVHHYGGSAWRWASEYRFAYSRRDDTWQLVRVKEVSFHAADPKTEETKTYVPPRDFGRIDIADFDPGNFKGVGKK